MEPSKLDDSLAETIKSVNRQRRQRDWTLSPVERLARFERLQAAAWYTLASNPLALEAFHRRNRLARRQSSVAKLLADMLQDRT